MIRIEIEMSTITVDQVAEVMGNLSQVCSKFTDSGAVVHRVSVEEADA